LELRIVRQRKESCLSVADSARWLQLAFVQRRLEIQFLSPALHILLPSQRESRPLEEGTISMMGEIAAIVEKGEQKGLCTKTSDLRHHLRVVRTYFALNAHHRHNKPPKTILPTIPAILTTIHPMNNSYNNMSCAPYMQRLP
jgi:hypothetical protein